MKRIFITLFISLIATVAIQAQQISVVNSNGETTLYSTLADAIEGADPGSVIYLPGGGFPISDEVKITKKLTIIGIGHYTKSGNVDGVTTISGSLHFNEGSDGSAVIACYITGGVFIGTDNAAVNDILVRYCNVDRVDVGNRSCDGTTVNQNYIRNACTCNYAPCSFTNNICKVLYKISGGTIKNNNLTGRSTPSGHWAGALRDINSSIISYNIIIDPGDINGSYNTITNNMLETNWGDDCIWIGSVDWNIVFVNWNNGANTPVSSFHFSEDYAEYEHQVGIYAGTSFNDDQLAPVPYIVAKHVDEHTDTSGKLNVKVRVKAGQ